MGPVGCVTSGTTRRRDNHRSWLSGHPSHILILQPSGSPKLCQSSGNIFLYDRPPGSGEPLTSLPVLQEHLDLSARGTPYLAVSPSGEPRQFPGQQHSANLNKQRAAVALRTPSGEDGGAGRGDKSRVRCADRGPTPAVRGNAGQTGAAATTWDR